MSTVEIAIRLRKPFILAFTLFAVVSLLQAAANALAPMGSQDFGVTWMAARVLTYANQYAMYLSGSMPPPDPHPMAASHAPSALMLLWPYVGFSWHTAVRLWLATNLLCTAGLLFVSLRLFLPGRNVWTSLLVCALFVAGLRWRNHVGNGQHLIFSLFFFVAAVGASRAGRQVLAGVLLAVSFLKYSTTFFLLIYFVYMRQWRPAAIAFAIHAAMLGFIWAWLGVSPVTMILQSLEIGGRVLTSAGYYDLFSFLPGVAAALGSLALAGVLLFVAIQRKTEPDVVFATLAMVATVVIYHQAYDYVLLLFPLIVAVRRWRTEPLLAALVFACVGMNWFVDKAVHVLTPWLDTERLASPTSVYFYGSAVLWYVTIAVMLTRCLTGSGSPRFANAVPQA